MLMVRAVCINRFADIFFGAGGAGECFCEHTNYIIFYFYGRHLCSGVQMCALLLLVFVSIRYVCVCVTEKEVKKADAKMPLKIVPSCDTYLIFYLFRYC